MSGRNDVDFVKYYVGKRYERYAEDDGTVHGAYGPRLFDKDGIDQFNVILRKLRDGSDTRKAVIQLYDARDTLKPYKDVPCTCTLQFVIRSGHLHMQTYMRSNDAYLGLPHDIFCFTMLQEVMAASLNVKLGVYKHAVGSLHLYTENANAAQEYLDEGFQDVVAMPAIRSSDPVDQIKKLLVIEAKIRSGERTAIDLSGLDDFWSDWARLLQVYAEQRPKEIVRLKNEMIVDVYETYIRRRHRVKVAKSGPPANDLPLFGG